MVVKGRIAGLHYGYVVLAAASLALIATLGFGRFTYSLILPGMKDGLSLNYGQMGLLGTSNMVGYLVAVPLAGLAASHFGSRLVMSGSMTITGLALLATGFSPGFEWALFFQTIVGLGSAGPAVCSMAAAGIWVAPRNRGLASGFVVGGVGLSFFASGAAIPALVGSYPEMGWRYAWYFVGGVVLASGLVVAALMRDRPQDLGLNPIGASMTEAPRQTPGGALNWGLVYKSGTVWHLAGLYGVFGFAYVSYLTFFAAFLSAQGGLSEGIIGNMWAISGAGLVIGAVIWGSLSDRLGRKLGIALTFAVLGASILLFTVSHSVVVYTLSAVLFWAAEPGVPVIVAACCGDYVGARLAPAAMGFTTLFMGIGQAAGPVLTGSLADMTGSFYWSFYLAAMVAGLGIVSALLLRQPKTQL
ncbi:MAG: YbfB/YjiJ family MFS transporter [Dehalococcoidia bacterium]|nr:YbfB/YjiJ family MFS transporter [Dehalococcoidia bacterium]